MARSDRTRTCLVLFVLLLARASTPARPAELITVPLTRVTVAAVGDLLMHIPIVRSVRDTETGEYRFAEVLGPIAPYLESADYTIANLETCLAGPKPGYRGYPRFNTPASLAGNLCDAGVDLVTTANNHCLDMGWEGLVATLDNLDRAGLAHVGTYRTAAEAAVPFVVEVRGVRLGILSFTNSTNALPIPQGKEFAVNLLSPEAVVAQAKAARQAGADVVIALLHFGSEYQRYPSAEQRQLAGELLRGGVDVIIGTHPHVVQPIETVTIARNGEPYQAVVAYSLGNFLSNQRDRYRDSGIILYLAIEKSEWRARVCGIRYLPVWVQKAEVNGRVRYRVFPVHPKIPCASDLPLDADAQRRMKQVWEELTAHLDDSVANIRPTKVGVGSGAFIR